MEGDDFIQNNYYDIGVAVGTERGLVVPVIRDADKKSFADIERDIADYAGKAREGKIKIEDLRGGVFTISNGGIYGSLFARRFSIRRKAASSACTKSSSARWRKRARSSSVR